MFSSLYGQVILYACVLLWGCVNCIIAEDAFTEKEKGTLGMFMDCSVYFIITVSDNYSR